ncbi:ATP-dependent Zn protease [Streptococcus pneumoniae]|nr:ATP-dependent Zn protease [Streptococcus pneumoniae]CNB17375.1 ATP-dependent Zn protease [Streptococcus pneumoniae]
MKKQAFSSEQYLNLQRDHILERINQFDGKLYLEFGGKMLEDFHLLVSFLVMNLTTKSSSCKN